MGLLMGNIDWKKLKDLDISKNLFGEVAAIRLGEILLDPRCNIRYLSLENCKLKNSVMELLCNKLMNNKSILHLNLAKNSIEDMSAILVSKIIGG
jgi:hypothetical protein